MKLELQINEKAIQDPTRSLAEKGILMTPPLNEEFWLLRVPVSDKQAIVGFPKFNQIGIGFQVEGEDWNTNLPSNCPAEEIYAHIECNKGEDPTREDCIAAIKMIQEFVTEMKAGEGKHEYAKPAKEPEVMCKCDNCDYTAPHSELPPAKDLLQRLTLGCVFTDVECPKCYALCFPI